MKTISISIIVLVICVFLFSQIAYFWEFEPYFHNLDKLINSILTLLHAVIIFLFTMKKDKEYKSKSERKHAESKLKYSACGLLFIDTLWAISYYCILYGI